MAMSKGGTAQTSEMAKQRREYYELPATPYTLTCYARTAERIVTVIKTKSESKSECEQ